MGELNQSQGRKTTKLKKLRLCSFQNLSALENVLRTGAVVMLCTTETQIEEIWNKHPGKQHYINTGTLAH